MVEIVAGTGSLGWFSTLWPVPAAITGFQPSYAVEGPSKATSVATSAEHPLWVRRNADGGSLWSSAAGMQPHVTAMVAGWNETHTNSPSSMRLPPGYGPHAVAAAVPYQIEALAPTMPVASLSSVLSSLFTAPTFSSPDTFTTVEQAIATLKTQANLSAALEAELRPSPAKLATWYPQGAPEKVKLLAERLLFAANAFRLGLVTTVLVPGYNDDPHNAWSDGTATATADALAATLEAFFRELATAKETRCGYQGAPLSLADNVLLLVYGDTLKNPFDRAAWPDGTPNLANVIYVRSNGWLVPGWFGEIVPGAMSSFSPSTGALAPGQPMNDPVAKVGALQAIVYAITRGNTELASTFSPESYAGLITYKAL